MHWMMDRWHVLMFFAVAFDDLFFFLAFSFFFFSFYYIIKNKKEKKQTRYHWASVDCMDWKASSVFEHGLIGMVRIRIDIIGKRLIQMMIDGLIG